jgi:cellulose biosynthesis protein BcsQ
MVEEFQKALVELISAFTHIIISSHEQEVGFLYWLKLVALMISFLGAVFYAYYWGKRAFREKIYDVLVDPDAFWSKKPKNSAMNEYRKALDRTIPIVSIANYKGGVGKSMISANLAAYLDSRGLRVLLIDFDYQGSLTDIVPYRNPDHLTFTAHKILQGSQEPKEIEIPQQLGQSFCRSFIHPSEAGLSRVDSQLIFQWLTGERKEDIRFNAQKYTSYAYVQNNFDLVIIDTPPRICAATANALCASTHVLMPTILDTVSTRALFRSVEMFLDFRDKLDLSFKILGVVPSKVQKSTQYNDRESKALAYLREELNGRYKNRVNHASGKIEPIKVLEGTPIMHKVGLLHVEGDDLKIFDSASNGNDRVIFEMFSRLGDYVISETRLSTKLNTFGDADADSRVAQGIFEFRGTAQARAG